MLPGQLAGVIIGYTHEPGLGGIRRPAPDSPNTGWRSLSFRGYADCIQTADFAENLVSQIELAQRDRVALMWAEAVPWRCHRSPIADALEVHGVATCETVSPKRLQAHPLTPFARVSGEELSYPPVGIVIEACQEGTPLPSCVDAGRERSYRRRPPARHWRARLLTRRGTTTYGRG